MVSDLDRFRGCLLGGAVGDALGGPIEFDRLASIQQSYGGMVDLLKLPRAAFTDDTQMTLFTAEGLITPTCGRDRRGSKRGWCTSCSSRTCGGSSGFYSAGALAAMVSVLMTGVRMEQAVMTARDLLDGCEGAGETIAALDGAVALAGQGVPEPEQLELLGGGWVGEEALAVAVTCALTAEDVAEALSAAVVHSGDSDSTGAICGNLLGAQLGIDAIPAAWIEALEGADVVDAVARDLWTERFDPPGGSGPAPSTWWERYPG